VKKKRLLKLYFCGSSNKDRKSYQLLDLFFFTRCLVKENPTSLEMKLQIRVSLD